MVNCPCAGFPLKFHSPTPTYGTLAVQLESLTLDSFAPRLQETFAVLAPDQTLDFVLAEVQPLGQSLNRRAFSLTFAGPLKPVLPQAIYRLNNQTLGVLELFLVPLGPKGAVCHYEAVFT
jgi:hypothetical protein